MNVITFSSLDVILLLSWLGMWTLTDNCNIKPSNSLRKTVSNKPVNNENYVFFFLIMCFGWTSEELVIIFIPTNKVNLRVNPSCTLAQDDQLFSWKIALVFVFVTSTAVWLVPLFLNSFASSSVDLQWTGAKLSFWSLMASYTAYTICS